LIKARTCSGLFLLHLVMLKVGVTGGIGAGKTLVCKIFEVLGVPVYYADEAAKELMQQNEKLIAELKIHFSDTVYDGVNLNRKYLSNLIFNNPEKRELLNNIVHPYVIQDGIEWMKKQQSPYAIKEAALIFESGSQESLDYIIGVFAPNSLKILRTIKRDHSSREEVLQKIESQIEDEIKMKLCDDVITNDEQHLLIPQVIAIHEKLCRMAVEKNRDE
jgi:dephospho-CoA kinase